MHLQGEAGTVKDRGGKLERESQAQGLQENDSTGYPADKARKFLPGTESRPCAVLCLIIKIEASRSSPVNYLRIDSGVQLNYSISI